MPPLPGGPEAAFAGTAEARAEQGLTNCGTESAIAEGANCHGRGACRPNAAAAGLPRVHGFTALPLYERHWRDAGAGRR